MIIGSDSKKSPEAANILQAINNQIHDDGSYSHQHGSISTGELFDSPSALPIQAKPRAIELCAGSASLSAKLAEFGFDPCAIDTKRNRFRVKFPITDMDLTNADSVQLISTSISSNGIQYVHAGVPCGTASRAREIPIPGNHKAPRALRSEREPWGRTDIVLDESEKLKRKAANQVYRNVASILKQAILAGAVVSIENPERSYLWELDCYQELLSMEWRTSYSNSVRLEVTDPNAHAGEVLWECFPNWPKTAQAFRPNISTNPGVFAYSKENRSLLHLSKQFIPGHCVLRLPGP